MSKQYPGPSGIHLTSFPPRERWDDESDALARALAA